MAIDAARITATPGGAFIAGVKVIRPLEAIRTVHGTMGEYLAAMPA